MLLGELEGAGATETEHALRRPDRPARFAEEQSGQRRTAARRMSATSGAACAHSHGQRGLGTSGGTQVRTPGRKLTQAWDPVHAYEQQSCCST